VAEKLNHSPSVPSQSGESFENRFANTPQPPKNGEPCRSEWPAETDSVALPAFRKNCFSDGFDQNTDSVVDCRCFLAAIVPKPADVRKWQSSEAFRAIEDNSPAESAEVSALVPIRQLQESRLYNPLSTQERLSDQLIPMLRLAGNSAARGRNGAAERQ